MGAKHAVEDGIYIAKLALQVEGVGQSFRIEIFRDANIRCNALLKARVGLPRCHSVFLYGFVGVITRHALFDQVLQQLAGINETVSRLEVAEHAVWEDAHLAEDHGHFGKHVVYENRGVGKDDALDGAVRDVAFVPERDIFEGGEHVGAYEAGEAANLFAGDGIALVRHGGTAALLTAKGLFGFADFCALKVAHFQSDFFERCGDKRQGAEILRVAVSLNDLRSDGNGSEAEALADAFFHFRAEMRSVADGARNLPNGHLRGGVAKARDVALIFREPVGDFQAEGDGLGMNAVGAANMRGVAEFVGAKIEDFSEHHQAALDELGRVAHLKSLRGVDDVIRGHAIVQPTRGGRITDGLAYSHGEGDDVVLYAGFNLMDLRDVDLCARTNGGRSVFGDETGLGESLRGGNFDFKPFGELAGVAPNVPHFLTRVTWNQLLLLDSEKVRRLCCNFLEPSYRS